MQRRPQNLVKLYHLRKADEGRDVLCSKMPGRAEKIFKGPFGLMKFEFDITKKKAIELAPEHSGAINDTKTIADLEAISDLDIMPKWRLQKRLESL